LTYQGNNYVKYEARHLKPWEKLSTKGIPDNYTFDYTFSERQATQPITLAILHPSGIRHIPHVTLITKAIKACNGFIRMFESDKIIFYPGYFVGKLPSNLFHELKRLFQHIWNDFLTGTDQPGLPYFGNLGMAQKRLGPALENVESEIEALLLSSVPNPTQNKYKLGIEALVEEKAINACQKISAKSIKSTCQGVLLPNVYQFLIVKAKTNNKNITFVLNAKNKQVLYCTLSTQDSIP
jgi:hypothetical protein